MDTLIDILPSVAIGALVFLGILGFLVSLLSASPKSTRRSPHRGGRPSSSASPLSAEPEPGEVRTIIYRTRDGTVDYQFRIVKFNDGNYRLYIISQPSYNGRPEDGHSTHRYWDEELGCHYVCWSVDITSYEDAKTIAAKWAEGTQQYRRTGSRF
jgi:hypothetical protein